MKVLIAEDEYCSRMNLIRQIKKNAFFHNDTGNFLKQKMEGERRGDIFWDNIRIGFNGYPYAAVRWIRTDRNDISKPIVYKSNNCERIWPNLNTHREL